MKSLSLRASLVLAVTALLGACGAGNTDTAAPIKMASVVHSAAVSGTSAAAMTAASSGTGATAPASGPGNPVPDCAPEGCKGLRIIDGNAEAWRVDAQRRAALEAAVSNTQL